MVPLEFNAFYDNAHESKRGLTMENCANLLRLYHVQLYKVNSIGNILSQGKSVFNLAAEFPLFPTKETLV